MEKDIISLRENRDGLEKISSSKNFEYRSRGRKLSAFYVE